MNDSGSAKRKYMDPVMHFIRKRMDVIQDQQEIKTTISELVPAGALLADFPDFNRYVQKGFEKSPLEAGINTEFSSDGLSLLAKVAGYPKVETHQRDDGESALTVIAVEPLIEVGADRMEAVLFLKPPIPEAQSTHQDDLPRILDEAGIVYGISPEAEQKAQAFLREGGNEFKRIVIARGKPPGKSSDASLRFELEIGPLAGRMQEDGSIDFRERRTMVGVHAGQHIATKIPVVPGEPGINVFGEPIDPLPGRDITVQVANDAAYSEEDLKVVAVKDGVLSVVNNSIIKVCAKQLIPGDIDYKIGNVESSNCLTIRGSIHPGFRVTADGDLEIGGGVSSATVVCQANVVVKGGITGKNSRIDALGDVDIRFIEQGSIDSGGIVVVRTQSYYSRIAAASNIRCQRGSKVMGGDLIAGRDLTVDNVGSENCESTLLVAGVDAKRLQLFKELQGDASKKQDEIIRWLQIYGTGAKSKKIRMMEEEATEIKLKLLQLNLIPDTGLYSRGGGEDSNDAGEEAGDIEKRRIDVTGTIFAGTRIRIGNRIMVLDKTVSNRQFRLQKNLRSIIAAPLR